MKPRPKQTPRGETSHRVIPPEVLEQLRAQLDSFPDTIRRMVVLLVGCGMRVSEVCSLPIDCLEQGSGLLRLGPLKAGEKRTIPLSPSTALVVEEQQHALMQTQEQHGAMDLLFRDSTGLAISPRTLLSSLNRLAIEKDIRDATGNVWRFRSFQFRTTLAAQMIQQHTPISVIQRYFGSGFMVDPGSVALLLGHTTPSMYLHYLRLPLD